MSVTVIAGHAADAPKVLKSTGLPPGVALVRFRLAVNRGRDKAPDWWTVVGRVPEWLPAAVIRGTALIVQGRASLEEWVAVDGTPRAGLRIDADRVQIAGGGRARPSGDMPLVDTSRTPAERAEDAAWPAHAHDDTSATGVDDDIPF